jgi:hypothetical protein
MCAAKTHLFRYSFALALSFVVAVVNLTVLGLPTIVLSVCFLVCALIWAPRSWHRVPGLIPTSLLAILVQCLHFGEELYSGFDRQFPALFERSWDSRSFIAFNLFWLIVFAVSAYSAAHNVSVAYLGLLFLGLGAGVANAIGHILLSLANARLFPGVYTAPLVLAMGLALLRQLGKAAARAD